MHMHDKINYWQYASCQKQEGRHHRKLELSEVWAALERSPYFKKIADTTESKGLCLPPF